MKKLIFFWFFLKYYSNKERFLKGENWEISKKTMKIDKKREISEKTFDKIIVSLS